MADTNIFALPKITDIGGRTTNQTGKRLAATKRKSFMEKGTIIDSILMESPIHPDFKLNKSHTTNQIRPKEIKVINGQKVPFYSKSIFNYHCELPRISKVKSHKFFKKMLDDGKKYNFASPDIKKTPGLSKIPSHEVQPAITTKHLNLSKMDSKYPRNNPLSQKLRLTEDLYASLTTNNIMQSTDRIEGEDNYNIEIDCKTEEDYLRNSIKMTGMQPAIDMKDIDLGSKHAVNDFYSHFKILNSVV